MDTNIKVQSCYVLHSIESSRYDTILAASMDVDQLKVKASTISTRTDLEWNGTSETGLWADLSQDVTYYITRIPLLGKAG